MSSRAPRTGIFLCSRPMSSFGNGSACSMLSISIENNGDHTVYISAACGSPLRCLGEGEDWAHRSDAPNNFNLIKGAGPMRRPRSDWMVMTSMNTHINVRMSESQRKAIEEKAAAMNMPASSFMRDAALLCGEKPVRVADAGELAGIRTELKKIGTNLNQAVRALNTYGSDPVVLNNLNRATSIVSTAVGWVNDLLARARE